MSEAAAVAVSAPLVIGRYALFDELAAGGMATVHLGRLLGPSGFGRTVAIKRLHAHYLKDQEFLTMFMDEARIVARIQHPNVVSMVDVVQSDKGLFLVMEYVHGESLSRLMRTARKSGEAIPPKIVAAIMCGVLLGLHSAHDTKGADGELLDVVHRDVSPQNVIIGADGSARVLDFGIAKAAGRAQVTREGQIKGKLAYMAPEQIRGQVDRRTDVFAASVVLWEMLAGRRLHEGAKDVDIVTRVVKGSFPVPSIYAPGLAPEIDQIVLRGLASNPNNRYATARDLALDLERKIGLATPSEVAAWVEHLAPEVLQARTNLVTAMELAAGDLVALESRPPPAVGMRDIEVVALPQFPVEVDMSNTVGEVPSSSAVFAHTPPGTTAVPSGSARRLNRSAVIVVAVSVLFALIGMVLGTYALLHGAPAAAAATPAPSATVLPRTTDPASTSSAAPADSASVAPEASGAVELDDTSVPPSASASASAGVNGTASAPPTPNLHPVPTPSAIPATSVSPAATPWKPPTGGTGAARPRPKCDPPFTVDAVGHRHYKPECMGLD